MDWTQILQDVLYFVIVVLIPVLTPYLISFIKAKSAELQTAVDSAISKKYLTLLTDTITKCVVATNQTYVDSLKAACSFTKEAQTEAFSKTLSAVKLVLSDEAKTYLTQAYGDLDTFLTTQIEATVNANKTE